MSLEETMKDLADSNRELAAAQKFYAGVIQKFGLKIEGTNEGTTAEAADEKAAPAADKKPKGRPAKAATKAAPVPEEEDDDDGMGEDEDEDEESELTREDVKNKLKEVIEATDDRKAASAIFKNLGYASVADIAEKDFQKVYDLAVKAIKKAG